MIKILVVLVVLLGAALSLPQVREAVDPVIAAVTDPAKEKVARQMKRVRDPVYRWSVKNEARGIVQELIRREQTGTPLPRPTDFQTYLRQRTLAEQAVVDRWGSPYYLLVTRDSVVVVSPGPDQRPGTGDDVRGALPRH